MPRSCSWEKILSNTTRYVKVINKGFLSPDDGEYSQEIFHYMKDAEIIIHSSYFRRLQGKTQVYPFPRFDYLRTRLTHSLEVSQIARSIAAKIARKLNEEKKCECFRYMPTIVHAACLCHDLGNPPYGHIGEEAIKQWFFKIKDERIIEMEDSEWNDFLYFDGNAQSFRIVTRLAEWRELGGYQLTYPVIASFVKYPYDSSHNRAKEKHKFGWFSTEKNTAHEIFKELGLVKDSVKEYKRHPLSYIVEAADDICYLTSDLEDAHRNGEITYMDIVTSLGEISGITEERMPNDLNHDVIQFQDKVSYLRSKAQDTMINSVVENFLQQKDHVICEGIIDNILETSQIQGVGRNTKKLKSLCKEKVYLGKDKLTMEQSGFYAINTCLDLFGRMAISYVKKGGDVEKISPQHHGLYYILPSEFRVKLSRHSYHESLQVILDYISGMTDEYIRNLVRKLTGGILPWQK